jgi:hypothetical protein
MTHVFETCNGPRFHGTKHARHAKLSHDTNSPRDRARTLSNKARERSTQRAQAEAHLTDVMEHGQGSLTEFQTHVLKTRQADIFVILV